MNLHPRKFIDYDGTILKSYCEKIVGIYIDKMKEFESRVQNLVVE